MCLCLLVLALFTPQMDAIAQNKSASSKSKKVPKVKKVKPRGTKRSKTSKVKKVKTRSASGKQSFGGNTYIPKGTSKKSVPKTKKVVPNSASGSVRFKERNVVPRSASGGVKFKNRHVTPRSASGGKRFKDRRVVPRTSAGQVGFKDRRVAPRSATGQQRFKDQRVFPRSASGQQRFKDQRVSPRTASGQLKFKNKATSPRYSVRSRGPDNSKVQIRSITGKNRYKIVKVNPRSVRNNPRYNASSQKNRLTTFPKNVASLSIGMFKVKGKRPKKMTFGGPRSVSSPRKYRVTRVTPRSILSNPKIKVNGRKNRSLTMPRNMASLYAGGVKKRGRRPRLNESQTRRSPAKPRRYKVVKVNPRSIPGNPIIKTNRRESQLLTFPKDVSARYVGNLKVRKGRKHQIRQNQYISYRGNNKVRAPRRRDVGTQFSGKLKKREPKKLDLGSLYVGHVKNRKNPKQRLDKSDYLKSKSKAQWAAYYRNKTKTQSNFLGFQKLKKSNKDKWMHPSVGYQAGRYKRTVEAKERTRKFKLWLSRKLKNDDQPKYLKMKAKKGKYDPKEIKIWSDYDNSRGRAEGRKTKKND